MKVGVIQSHIVVGDMMGSAERFARDYRTAVAMKAEIVLGQEDALAGYCEGDQRLYPSFSWEHKRALEYLAGQVGDVPLVMSVTLPNEPKGKGKPFYNMAVIIQNGVVKNLQPKTNLATDTVFNDYRWYEMNHGEIAVFNHKGLRCAVLVCQDGWASYDAAHGEHFFPRDPVNELKEKGGVDLVLMPNASPYFWKKGRERFYVVQEIRRKLHCAVAYANYWGGQDELVFDGRSFIVARDGTVVGAARPFEDAVVVADLDGEAVCYPFDDEIQDLEDALVISLRDYVEKSGFPGVVLGLSGGIDSAVVAALAVKALGPGRVLGVRMPSKYSSRGSLDDAEALAKNLGISLMTIPIETLHAASHITLEPALGHKPGENPKNPKAMTDENLQARIRGMILMAISNDNGYMVVSTGNKSEMGTGFATLYGDMCGGFALIKDVYKLDIFALARNMNKSKVVIPENTITKPPSAELRPGQVDSDALPPYDVLDPILKLHVEESLGLDEVVEKGFAVGVAMRVITLTRGAEYKRRQAPPGPIMTKNGLAWLNRQYPITSRFAP